MSVILLGDGTITSSVALTTLTLGNPIATNPFPQTFENREDLEGDGGVLISYKKGRRGLNHILRIPWLSLSDVYNLKRFFEVVDSTNWFTLQDNLVQYKSVFAHESLTGQKVIIYSPIGFSTSWLYIRIELTALCMSVVGGGGNTGERRRIVDQESYSITVDPGFTNNIQVNDTFLIGVPVIFTSPPKIEPIRSNAFKVELNFKEKIF